MAKITKQTYIIQSTTWGCLFTLDVWEKSYDVIKNTSVVSYSWDVKYNTGTGFNGSQRNNAGNLYIYIDGKTVLNGQSIPLKSPSFSGYIQASGKGETTVTHNSDGKKTISFGMKLTRGGGNYTNDPYVWNPFDTVSSNLKLTDIDRAKAKLSNVNLTSSITSAKVTFACDSEIDEIQYNLNSVGWKNVSYSNDRSFAVYNLSPSTAYTLQFSVKKKSNQVWTNSDVIQFTTPKPDAPSKGTAQVRNVTPFSATIYYSEFKFSANSSWGFYQVAIGEDFNSTPWVNNGRNTTYTRNNLKPNTKYKAWVRLVDNYGTPSETIEIEFTTPSDQAKIWIYNFNRWLKGKLWLYSKGKWRKAKRIWVYKNGSWKPNKS